MVKRGVIYCATTKTAYLEAALISAIALRQQEPALPITLLSDQPLLTRLPLQDYGLTPRLLDRHDLGQQAFSSRSIKTRLNAYSPYEETLFLDADILPLQPVSHLWGYLNESDLAMVVDRLPMVSLCDHVAQEEKAYTLQQLPGHTVQFNSGVMLWRDSLATQVLFRQWHEEWQQFQKHDQLALIRAIKAVQIPVTKLPMTYNISPMDAASLMDGENGVHLLHCWGGMVASGAYRQFAKQYYPLIVETVVAQLVADERLAKEQVRQVRLWS
jgi:hypothetical protein